MNNLLSLAHNILLDIIDKDTEGKSLTFGLAIKKAFHNKNIAGDMKGNATALVGCAMRHQILFDELIARSFGEVSSRVRSGIFLYLSNKLFVTKVEEAGAFEFMKQKFADDNVEFDNDLFNKLDESTNDKQKLVPSEYDAKSLEFLSLRFNTPLWIVKMWKKQFGPQLSYPILLANGKGAGSYYRVNTSLISMENFLKEFPYFEENTHVPGIVSYVGDKSQKKANISNNKYIFEYNLGFKKVFDGLDCDPIRGIAVYTGTVNNSYLELMSILGKDAKFDLIVKKGEPYFYAKKLVERYGLAKASLYDAEPSSIITCISKPVHTFIVFPESSDFDQIRVTPDYLYHFKQDSLDGYLNAQREALNETSALVEDGGNLAYMVSTINHKEGKAQIIAFLHEHKEFHLVEEKQIFPFDKMDCALYYAILKKEEIKDD